MRISGKERESCHQWSVPTKAKQPFGAAFLLYAFLYTLPMAAGIRIISIDPGYDRCGVAVLEKNSGKEVLIASDCFTTNRTDPFPVRLAAIFTQLQDLITTHKPQALALERLYVTKNQKTAMMVSEVRGAILALAGLYSLSVQEFTPNQIKLAVTGYGSADKTQVMHMIPKLVRIEKTIRHDDEFDAIAVGLTYLAHMR